MDYNKICDKVAELTVRVGTYITSEAEKFEMDKVEKKGHNDFVSHVDKTAEMILVEELTRILPEAGFIVEEDTTDKKSDTLNWIVDPLDGTTNFIHGYPCYAISVALMEEDELVAGVVYEMVQDECFYAWKDGGAYMNNSKIHVSSSQALKDSLIGTGFPYYDYERMDEYMKLFEYLMRNTHGLRRPGSAASDLAYVACGRFDGFYEYSLHPWDVAAGVVLIKEAGGQVADFKGGSDYLFNKEIIAANPHIFNEFLLVVGDYMNK